MKNIKTLKKIGKASLIAEFEGPKIVSAYIMAKGKKIKFPQLTVDQKTKTGFINSLEEDCMQRYAEGSLEENLDQFRWGKSYRKRKMDFKAWVDYALETIGGYLKFYT